MDDPGRPTGTRDWTAVIDPAHPAIVRSDPAALAPTGLLHLVHTNSWIDGSWTQRYEYGVPVTGTSGGWAELNVAIRDGDRR